MSERRSMNRTIRLQDFDYRQPGFYFITICVRDHKRLFGEIEKGKMHLNRNGHIVQDAWNKLPQRFPGVELDEYVIMPNHIHGIIVLKEEQPVLYRNIKIERVPERFKANMQTRMTPYKHMPVLGDVIRTFKGEATYYIRRRGTPEFAWQGRFYDSIISNEKVLTSVRFYIINNPENWAQDKLYQPK